MDETPEQKYNRMADAVQQSILRNYPNPNREGCPGDAAVRELASRTEVRKDELWRHITHCSPCYAEFLKYRTENRQERARQLQSRRRFLVAASLTVVAAGGGVSYVLLRDGRTYQISWDLESQKTFRGLDEGRMEGPSGPPLSAPAARLHITLTMPKGSQPAEYEAKLWRSLDRPPVFSQSVQLPASEPRLNFDADLSGSPPGSYTLGIRRRGTEPWRYFAVSVTSA